MDCPYGCWDAKRGRPAQLLSKGFTDQGPLWERRTRRCATDSRHVVETVERATGIEADLAIDIRQRGSGQQRPYDQASVRNSIADATMLMLGGSKLADVVTELEGFVRFEAVTRGVRDDASGAFVVGSDVLQRQILSLLRNRKPRLNHVLYATAHVGRIDIVSEDDRRLGWLGAADMLEWIWRPFARDREAPFHTITEDEAFEAGGYDDLVERLPEGVPTSVETVPEDDLAVADDYREDMYHRNALIVAGKAAYEGASSESAMNRARTHVEQATHAAGGAAPSDVDATWIANRLRPSEPRRVIKESNDGREMVSFVPRQFVRSIELALQGRRPVRHPADPSRNPRRELAQLIAAWVLRDLEGQAAISADQLGVTALRTLRRVDDIAYLRYAVKRKRMTRVTDFVIEALGLVSHPSRRLRFVADDTAPVAQQ